MSKPPHPRQPKCCDCGQTLPTQTVFNKIENITRRMQDEQGGITIKTAKIFMSKIPDVFTGGQLIQWMMRNLKLEDQQEAIHLANLVGAHGYIFSVEDHVMSIKSDCTFYRFQSPGLWPSNSAGPEAADYAVYLCKRTMQGKSRLLPADYEVENLANLQKTLFRKWKFISSTADLQAQADMRRDKLERRVLDSQERAIWDVYRPVPGCVNTTEMDIKKASRLSRLAKRCGQCSGACGRPVLEHEADTWSTPHPQTANTGCEQMGGQRKGLAAAGEKVASLGMDAARRRQSLKREPGFSETSSREESETHHDQQMNAIAPSNQPKFSSESAAETISKKSLQRVRKQKQRHCHHQPRHRGRKHCARCRRHHHHRQCAHHRRLQVDTLTSSRSSEPSSTPAGILKVAAGRRQSGDAPERARRKLSVEERKLSELGEHICRRRRHSEVSWSRANLECPDRLCGGKGEALNDAYPSACCSCSCNLAGSKVEWTPQKLQSERSPRAAVEAVSEEAGEGAVRLGSKETKSFTFESRSEESRPNSSDGLEQQLRALRLQVDERVGGLKMSKVTQSYLSYFNQWAEYDPFKSQPIPSNPWIAGSTKLWDPERQTKDVHLRRVRRWAFSLRELLSVPAGRLQFHRFLEKEFSAENLKFWDAVQELKRVHTRHISKRVELIWSEFLAQDANYPINIDSKSYESSKLNMSRNRNNRYIFDEAAGHVYQLMRNDSYPRYLRSDMYRLQGGIRAAEN